MTIRFKCPSCQKPLGVKDHLAGKKATCPVCKKPLRIPTPKKKPEPSPPADADIDAIAAAAFADEPAQKKAEPTKAPEFIKLTCEFCFEEIQFPAESAGQREPCPECKRIIKVPDIKKDEHKPRDWRDAEKKKGPSLAKKEAPAELEGAWGTAVSQGRVSAEALVEADAIVYEEDPVGWGGWAKRIGIGVAVVLVGYVIVTLLNRSLTIKQEKANVKQLAIDVEKEKEPAWRGELFRGIGQYQAATGNVADALQKFTASRAQFAVRSPANELLRDIILMKLAINQLNLATTDKDALLEKKGYPFGEIQKEVRKTLDKLSSIEAKRLMFQKLRKHFPSVTHEPLLQGLATVLRTPNDTTGGGVLLAMTVRKYQSDLDKKERAALQTQINAVAKSAPAWAQRLGYAEGYALQGEFEKAKTIVGEKGPVLDRFRAALGVAAVALEKNSSEAEAFVKFARSVYPTNMNPSQYWLYIEFFRLVAKTASLDAAKKLIPTFPKAVQPVAHLEGLMLRLEGSKEKADTKWIEEIPARKSLARALAWEAVSQHNARLGYTSEVENYLELTPDERYRPFIRLGMLLAE